MDFHKIQPSDFQAILDLLDTAFPVSRAVIERDLKEIQKHPKANGEIHGLWVDGELVGTATYGAIHGSTSSGGDDEVWDGEGLIRYLTIDPKHRRKGYATWIIKKAIADLKQVGSPCVAVSVLAEDTVAVKMWEDFGFEYYDTHTRDEYGTHHSYALWF